MVVDDRGCYARDGNPSRRPTQTAPAVGKAWGRSRTPSSLAQASSRRQGLELQAAFARGVGQGLDATVEAVARAVEGDLLDAGSLRLFGDGATDLGGGFGVLAVLQPVLDVGLGGRGGGQDLGAVGGEDLGVQVL